MQVFFLLLFWNLWLFNFSSRIVISPLLPIIEDELAISHALAGSFFFIFSIGYTSMLLLGGLISARIGHKRPILLGYLIIAGSLVCLRYAQTYLSFATVYLFTGLGSGIYMPCAVPLITATFRSDNWGKALAFHETAPSLASLSVPILTVFALRFFQWRDAFVILSGALLMIATVFWIFGPDLNPQEEKKAPHSSLLGRIDFWIMAVIWLFGTMNLAGLYSITPLFLVKERMMNMEVANTVFGFSRVGGIVATILIGFVLDRYDVKKILLVILLTAGLATIGLALAHKFWLLVVMLFIQPTIGMAFFPIGLMAISRITSVNERGIFTGTALSLAAMGGMGFAPLCLGAVADVWSFQVGILLMGIATTVSCVFLKGLKGL